MGNTLKFSGLSAVKGTHADEQLDELSVEVQGVNDSDARADDTPIDANQSVDSSNCAVAQFAEIECKQKNNDSFSDNSSTAPSCLQELIDNVDNSVNPAQDNPANFYVDFIDTLDVKQDVTFAQYFLLFWFEHSQSLTTKVSISADYRHESQKFICAMPSTITDFLQEAFDAPKKPKDTQEVFFDICSHDNNYTFQPGFAVDVPVADKKSANGCPDVQTVLLAIKDLAYRYHVAPRFIVTSLDCLTLYWQFFSGEYLKTLDDFDKANQQCRQFAHFLRDKFGFDVQPVKIAKTSLGVHDCRLPGSLVRFKNGRRWDFKQCKLLYSVDATVEFESHEIDSLLEDGKIPALPEWCLDFVEQSDLPAQDNDSAEIIETDSADNQSATTNTDTPPVDAELADVTSQTDAPAQDNDSAEIIETDSAEFQDLTVAEMVQDEVPQDYESYLATDTATLVAHIDDTLKILVNQNQTDEIRFYTAMLISLKKAVNTAADEWIVDTSRWLAENVGSTLTLAKIMTDAEIDASIQPMVDEFNNSCQFERWFVEDIPEADNFVLQIMGYLYNPAGGKKDKGDIKEQLQQAKDKLEALLAKSAAAREKLKDVQTFGNDVIYSDEFLNAAAFAKVDDDFVYKSILSEIRRFRDIHKTDLKISDWKNAVKERAKKYQAEIAQLKIDIQSIKAKESEEYFRQKTGETYLSRVEDYVINYYGIMQYPRDSPPRPICRAGVILAEKVIGYETKIIQYVLRVWTSHANSFLLPPVNAESLFNAASLLKLANYGLPVTTRNATRMTDFLDAYRHAVELKDNLKTRYTVSRCGWHLINGKEIIADKYVFVDPRREVTVELPMVNQGLISYSVGLKTFNLSVDTSSQFAQNLQIKGSLAEWKKAYDIAKQYPVARLVIAAAVSTAFLAILRERNSMLYIHGKSRGGKTTALKIAASTIGTEKVFRTFDGTKNGLAGAAADVNDYPFLLDEKQSIENKLTEQLENLVHALTDGVGRTRLNRNSTVKDVATWRTNIIATGETPLFESYHNEGVNTRSISIHAPDVIIPKNDCAAISDIIKDNFGLIYPLLIDKIMEFDVKIWKDKFVELQQLISRLEGNLLNEHNRFLSLYLLGDITLNLVLGESAAVARACAVDLAKNILPLIPLQAEFDKTQDAIDFVDAFVVENQNNFVIGDVKPYGKTFGQIMKNSNRIYILKSALQDACKAAGRNCDKLVDDLIEAERIEPSRKIEPRYKKPRREQVQKINNRPARCYVYLGTLYTEFDKDSD